MRKSIKNYIPKYNASGFLNFCPSHVHLIMQVNFSLFHHHQQCAITSHILKMCLYVPYYGGAMNEETSKASDKQTAPLRGLRSHAYTIFTSNYELHNKALMRMWRVCHKYINNLLPAEIKSREMKWNPVMLKRTPTATARDRETQTGGLHEKFMCCLWRAGARMQYMSENAE